MAEERLQKFLSRCGVSARRKAEELIRQGRVTVNGHPVTDPQTRIVPGIDSVMLNGKRIREPSRHTYIALNKPAAYISDLADPRGRKLARDLIDSSLHLFPVGRLDYASEGLIIFTDDGDFANRVIHPRYKVEREYLVKLKGRLNEKQIALLISGLVIEGRTYRVRRIVPVKPSVQNYWYSITVTEGRNRMLRIMGDAIRHPVLRLRRIRIGPLRLGDLKPGSYRFLTPRELSLLVSSDDMPQ